MLDLLFRAAYRAAYLLMRVHWAVLRPRTRGVLVSVWHGGEVLIVRNGYQRYLSMPGGYLKRGEEPAAAAVRELREEVGLRVAPEELRPVFTMHHRWLGKDEEVVMLEHRPEARPTPIIDRREVVEARFRSPAEALHHPLLPPVRRVLEEAVRARAAPGGPGRA